MARSGARPPPRDIPRHERFETEKAGTTGISVPPPGTAMPETMLHQQDVEVVGPEIVADVAEDGDPHVCAEPNDLC